MLARNSNLRTIHASDATTIKHLEIGDKSDVTAVAMVTPIFYFIKHFFKVQ